MLNDVITDKDIKLKYMIKKWVNKMDKFNETYLKSNVAEFSGESGSRVNLITLRSKANGYSKSSKRRRGMDLQCKCPLWITLWESRKFCNCVEWVKEARTAKQHFGKLGKYLKDDLDIQIVRMGGYKLIGMGFTLGQEMEFRKKDNKCHITGWRYQL